MTVATNFSDSSVGLADGFDVNALRALHDQLLAEKPDGAVHDEENCPLCGSEESKGGCMATFSEEELQAAVDAAVAEATASLTSKIAELEATRQQESWDQAKTELEAKMTELQNQLDAAVLEAAQAKEERDSIQKAWDDEKAEAEAAQQIAARREERLAKVREVASFPDEYLEQNADRFAAMSDEDFNARVEEWTTLSKPKGNGSALPAKTALTASRQESSGGESALGALREFRLTNTDPRTL